MTNVVIATKSNVLILGGLTIFAGQVTVRQNGPHRKFFNGIFDSRLRSSRKRDTLEYKNDHCCSVVFYFSVITLASLVVICTVYSSKTIS